MTNKIKNRNINLLKNRLNKFRKDFEQQVYQTNKSSTIEAYDAQVWACNRVINGEPYRAGVQEMIACFPNMETILNNSLKKEVA